VLAGAPAFGAGICTPDPLTLHVYEDLLQVSTLVLNSQGESYPDLTAGQFTIQLDQGPPFHPRHVRLEGDDPLSLVILLDAASPSLAALAATLPRVFGQLPENWLREQDHLSFYAVDCGLIRSFDGIWSTPEMLQDAVVRALAAPDLHARSPSSPPCSASRRLWDTLASIAVRSKDQGGRRVIMALTDGEDHGSHNSWRDLGRYSMAILGLRPLPGPPPSLFFATLRPGEDNLSLLCSTTGGVVIPVEPRTLDDQLRIPPAMLRHRYILDFSPPSNGSAGLHDMEVSIQDRSALVRATGIGLPIPDKALRSRPDTIPSDTSQAPKLGDRRILTQPR
jgi:hypothetical protein